MERVAFLRSLQKAVADQNYLRAEGAGSGLSEHGAVGLGEKIAMAAGKIMKPQAKSKPGGFSTPMAAPQGTWSNFGRAASEEPRDPSRSPDTLRYRAEARQRMRSLLSAAAGSSSQPMVYD